MPGGSVLAHARIAPGPLPVQEARNVRRRRGDGAGVGVVRQQSDASRRTRAFVRRARRRKQAERQSLGGRASSRRVDKQPTHHVRWRTNAPPPSLASNRLRYPGTRQDRGGGRRPMQNA